MLQLHQEDNKDAAKMLLQNLNNRIRQLESRNLKLVHALEYCQTDIDHLKCENKSLKKEITNLQKGITKKTDNDDDLQNLKDRMDYQEHYSTQINLHFAGLRITPNETLKEARDKVQHLLQDQFNIRALQLEKLHMVEAQYNLEMSGSRTMVTQLNYLDDKQPLANSSTLNSLCEPPMQAKEAQLSALKQTKSSREIAYVSHTKLILRDGREKSDIAAQQSLTSCTVGGGGGGTDDGAGSGAGAGTAAPPAAGLPSNKENEEQTPITTHKNTKQLTK